MIPILFSPTATEFETNGLGMLADAVSCKVSEELNSSYELTITYPLSGKRFGDIQPRGIVLAKPNPYAAPQPFRIYDISKPMRGSIAVHARHLSYDLSGIPVAPFSADNLSAALNGLRNNAVVPCPFTFQTDKSVSAAFSVAVPSAIRSLLGGQKGSVLDVYTGEYEWDGYTVKLLARRGQDNGVSIRYGKNLTDLKQEENIANIATGVYPFWQGMDGRVVEAPEKIVNAAGTYNFVRVLPLDLTTEFETEPTPEQIKARAETYVERNNIGVPAVSISVSFQPLEQTEEYKDLALLERVQLGDTVTVEYPALGVSSTARVTAAVYDVLLDRYDRVQLGSVRARLSATIAEQQKEIAQRPTTTEAQRLTDSILGALGGAVRLLDNNGDGWPDTLYIADNPDPAQAVKVWRFNYEGWGASSNGYNGPFVMGATLDEGMVADFISTGSLSANLVRAGVLRSNDGNTYFDLNNGEITSVSADGLTRITIRGWDGGIFFEQRDSANDNWTNLEEITVNNGSTMRRYDLWDGEHLRPMAYLKDDGTSVTESDALHVKRIIHPQYILPILSYENDRCTMNCGDLNASGTLNVGGEIYMNGKALVDYFYPVNSVYISYSHTNPGTLFGGTWQRITNAFLWAAGASDSIGATGGEKTHTLTADELPKLSGGALFRDIDLGDSNLLMQTSGVFSKSTTAWEGTHAALTTEDKTSGYLRSRLGLDFGGDKAHNNMPPYVQVSIWRRTA